MNRPSALLRTLLFAIALLTIAARAADSPREKLLLDPNWRFSNGDPEKIGNLFDYPEAELSKQNAASEEKANALSRNRPDDVKTNIGGDVSWVQPGFDDSKWRTVNLPHDWAIEMPFNRLANTNKGSRQLGDKDGTGIGWYRRHFDVEAADKGKTIWIEFGGSYRNTLVWLNGHCLGRMASGYTPFYFDVTQQLNYGGKNTLVARVDARKDEGWFYEGAGIYRHVWMIKTQPVHVAHWGTYITSKVAENSATLAIETTLENKGARAVVVDLVSIVQDAAGTEIARAESPVPIEPGGQSAAKQSVAVENPKLWSPETPNMYTLVTRIESAGSLSDRYQTPFGIRTVEFKPDGFYLNGQHRFIKGVCNHQDFAGVGSAVPDRVEEYRVAMLREMGCDGWRTSHNPVNEELLDQCDRQGMMVMDENRRFGKYAEPLSDLKAMMLRDRNHPSVVIWSLGNEEMGLQGGTYGAEACKAMQDLAHQIDPTRACTLAINHGFDSDGFTTVLDVTGMNYLKLWGGMSRFHEEHPDRRYITSEEASTLTTRGLYFMDKPNGYLTAYDSYVPGWGSTAEGWWNYYQTRQWVGGAFVWTGFDYRGEPTPYGWPCISSHFGILDTCGFPKDNYYYYKAWWTNEPVLHLYPHWNWNQVGHRLIKVHVKTALPKTGVFYGGAGMEPHTGTKDGSDWTFFDDGGFTRLTVKLDEQAKPNPAAPKAKPAVTPVVNQDVMISAAATVTTLKPLAAAAAANPAPGEVTISETDAPINIWTQTNYEEAELFVNGASRGRQKVNPMHHVEWTVPYTPGSISVIGYRGGRAMQTEKIETTGPASALRVTANRKSINGDGEDVVLLKVEALDDVGRFVATANTRLHFEVKGSGKMLGVGNGDPSCHESDKGPDRSLFNGLALCLVQAGRGAGTVTVTVTGAGLHGQALTLPVDSAPERPFVP